MTRSRRASARSAQFGSCLFSGEYPVDPAGAGVALMLPGGDFGSHVFPDFHVPVEALGSSTPVPIAASLAPASAARGICARFSWHAMLTTAQQRHQLATFISGQVHAIANVHLGRPANRGPSDEAHLAILSIRRADERHRQAGPVSWPSPMNVRTAARPPKPTCHATLASRRSRPSDGAQPRQRGFTG